MKKEEKKIKVWNPYFWVFDLNPKVLGMEISSPLVMVLCKEHMNL